MGNGCVSHGGLGLELGTYLLLAGNTRIESQANAFAIDNVLKVATWVGRYLLLVFCSYVLNVGNCRNEPKSLYRTGLP